MDSFIDALSIPFPISFLLWPLYTNCPVCFFTQDNVWDLSVLCVLYQGWVYFTEWFIYLYSCWCTWVTIHLQTKVALKHPLVLVMHGSHQEEIIVETQDSIFFWRVLIFVLGTSSLVCTEIFKSFFPPFCCGHTWCYSGDHAMSGIKPGTPECKVHQALFLTLGTPSHL